MKTTQDVSASKRILFRCDGSSQLGFGHIVRCIALADELRDQHGFNVDFAMLKGYLGVKQVQKHGYLVYQPNSDPSEPVNESLWLQSVVRESMPQALLLDVRTDLPVDTLREIKKNGVMIVTIDDISDRRLIADLAFYPPIPQVDNLDWNQFTGKCFVGYEWILLKPVFADFKGRIPFKRDTSFSRIKLSQPLNVLVSMGGSDPAGLTLMMLKVLDTIEARINVSVLIGNGFMHNDALATWLSGANRKYELHRDAQDIPFVMYSSDCAIVSFGVTAYELAAMEVPAIYVCLTDDHHESASYLEGDLFGVSLGVYTRIASHTIKDRLIQFFAQFNQPLSRPKPFVDGLGYRRTAAIIDCHI